jgi:hypothetical protein
VWRRSALPRVSRPFYAGVTASEALETATPGGAADGPVIVREGKLATHDFNPNLEGKIGSRPR